ncbi:arginine--tRNA ligase, partial [archaeon]
SQQQLAALVASPYARAPRRPDAERVLVDFGSPNMGKELHVGHLRSSVVGDTIARLLEFLGHDVTRLSHVGDAGLPIAIVLAEYFMRAFGSIPRGASDAQLRTMLDAADAAWMRDADAASLLPSAHELSSVYESAKRQMDTAGKAAAGVPSALADAHAAARATHFAADAQQLLRDLQAVLAGSALPEGASPAYAGFLKHAWTQLCAASRAGYEPLFQRLGVQVTEAGESTYADGLASVVEELQRSGVATLSDGALVLFVDGADKSPLLIRKADGGFLYATTDLVCLRRRLEGGFTRIVYITDQSQAVHFRQVFAAARMAGWITPDGRNALSRDRLPVSLEHAYFGVVTGEGGRKLSSRDGTPHTLASLLAEGDAAATRACLGAPDATAAAAAAATANAGSEATSDAAAAAAAATG